MDDVWLTAEEWVISSAFNRADGSLGHAMANETMGLAATITDIENSTLYSVPALGTTGYEKMMPLNPGTEEYQVMVMAGYNHGHEPAPLKIFIGRKGYDAEGNKIASDYNERDQFLGRNGLLWGQLYGQAVSNKTIKNLGLTNDSNGNGLFDEHIVDEYLTNAAAPDKFKGRFYPTSFHGVVGMNQQPLVISKCICGSGRKSNQIMVNISFSRVMRKPSIPQLIRLAKPDGSRI